MQEEKVFAAPQMGTEISKLIIQNAFEGEKKQERLPWVAEKVWVICSRGQHRSRYIASLLREWGYNSSFAGQMKDCENWAGKKVRQLAKCEGVVFADERIMTDFFRQFPYLERIPHVFVGLREDASIREAAIAMQMSDEELSSFRRSYESRLEVVKKVLTKRLKRLGLYDRTKVKIAGRPLLGDIDGAR